ncbi:M3 family oligoendopeptidase [Candidatus Collierbacteria bacterium]|nr:M3 family oligoendopeptidase [Candidatus Collierbacteria bacterium]
MKKQKQDKYVWNLGLIFANDNDVAMKTTRKQVEEVAYRFINKWKDRNDYLQKPAVLKEALDEYEEWMRTLGIYDAEIYYFSLRTYLDQLDPKLKGRYNQILEKWIKFDNDSQFFRLRIAKTPSSLQAKFLKYPGLVSYKHFLEMLFGEAKYQLTEPEEKILTLKHQTSHANWVKMVDSLLSKEEREVTEEDGKKVKMGFADLYSLLYRQNKAVRDGAAVAINEVLAKYVDVAEQEMNSILANKKINDELRSFPRPDSARHLTDDVNSGVVDIMLEVVSSRFSLSSRWYKLKAKLLGLSKFDYHERLVQYGTFTKSYSIDETIGIISKTFHKLDPEFGQIFDGFVDSRQIDVFPTKGKKDGAFCTAGSLRLPTYILLNHTNILGDVRTLAHEAGHGINDELMRASQNALNFGSPLSTAEVASTFMEDFIWEELMAETDDELRLAIMAKKLDDDIGTIFRQVACYRFEQELHWTFRKKGYVGKKEIGKLFQKHMGAYLGPTVKFSEGSENWWIYWGHIRSFFYVYSYASGLLISKSLQAAVKKNPGFVKKVKEFLAAGSSDSPRNIFLKLGIDITDGGFWERGLLETERLLIETETLAKKLGKI